MLIVDCILGMLHAQIALGYRSLLTTSHSWGSRTSTNAAVSEWWSNVVAVANFVPLSLRVPATQRSVFLYVEPEDCHLFVHFGTSNHTGTANESSSQVKREKEGSQAWLLSCLRWLDTFQRVARTCRGHTLAKLSGITVQRVGHFPQHTTISSLTRGCVTRPPSLSLSASHCTE